MVHAFASVDAAGALHAAEAAEREIRAGRYRGPLHGVPVAIKDNYDTVGVPTRNGSTVFTDRMPSQDATAWVRLREAGAVMLGKTTMSEAAWGVDFPPVRNPWDVRRNPGLSSGGSGAAVAAGLCYMAMGSDTGGSIRIPAGLSGVVGLKATYGRVPRSGVVPHTWSLDHAGPLTRRVEDCAIVLAAIAGHDARDPAVRRGAGRRLPARSEARRPRPSNRRAPRALLGAHGGTASSPRFARRFTSWSERVRASRTCRSPTWRERSARSS